MQSLPTVFTSSVEDTTDDFISTLFFSEMREMTKPLLNHNGDLTLLQEAKNNFITQISMGLTLWAYTNVMTYVEKIALRTGAMWTYIVAGKVGSKINQKIKELKSKNIKGKKALNLLGTIIGSDKTHERIEVMKIANTQLTQIDKRMEKFKNEKQMIDNKFIAMGATSAQIKGVSSQENFNLYMHKTKTSTWQKTATDRKLFEKITGEKISTVSASSWGDLVDTLNQYSEFAKDSENKIFNLTEAILKVVNRANIAK
jgi:hypothetical protein